MQPGWPDRMKEQAIELHHIHVTFGARLFTTIYIDGHFFFIYGKSKTGKTGTPFIINTSF
jgi:hypothetical protein